MKTVSVMALKRLGITSCARDTKLFDIATTMHEEDISSLVVVDENQYLEGIITRTDVVRAALSLPEGWGESTCQDWMTRSVITVDPSTSLESSAHILQSQHIHSVVVVERDGDRMSPIAVISDSDIVYHLVTRSD